ncbi:MAG: argininosuccinate lyase [Candidatus Saganbacteria bacterium]|nr:argininosuccinate lyase [Candidatus Saganbacteria bacterium]
MKSAARSGRFSTEINMTLEDFNSSVHFDRRLYKQDIALNIAYAKALLGAKVLKQKETSQIISSLKKIEKEIESGKTLFKKEYEDIHLNIETILTQKIGEAGKKIHTGRSRNDQVSTDMRMYLKEETAFIMELIKNFQKTLLKIAEESLGAIMPGYTHLQRAQPILFSHYIMAYYEMLFRDRERLAECLKRMDVMPLGSAALAGTSYRIDRKKLAKDLKFKSISRNSIDAVSDRDFVIEFLACISILMVHLSRLSEEIVLWTSSEFKFMDLSDSYATGSSIMPQKKNPDVAELTRGKTGRVFGDLMAILTVMKGLPLAYNRDMQEDKERLFDGIDTVKAVLIIMEEMLKTTKINAAKMHEATEKGCLTATDLADYLVGKGLPFRKAHEVTGEIVRYCVDNRLDLYQMSKKDLKKFCDRIGEDIHDHLTIENSVNSRDIIGGTARRQVQFAIRAAKVEMRKK